MTEPEQNLEKSRIIIGILGERRWRSYSSKVTVEIAGLTIIFDGETVSINGEYGCSLDCFSDDWYEIIKGIEEEK